MLKPTARLGQLLLLWQAWLQERALDGTLRSAATDALLLEPDNKALLQILASWSAGVFTGLPTGCPIRQ